MFFYNNCCRETSLNQLHLINSSGYYKIRRSTILFIRKRTYNTFNCYKKLTQKYTYRIVQSDIHRLFIISNIIFICNGERFHSPKQLIVVRLPPIFQSLLCITSQISKLKYIQSVSIVHHSIVYPRSIRVTIECSPMWEVRSPNELQRINSTHSSQSIIHQA